jgi:hypothetical protein
LEHWPPEIGLHPCLGPQSFQPRAPPSPSRNLQTRPRRGFGQMATSRGLKFNSSSVSQTLKSGRIISFQFFFKNCFYEATDGVAEPRLQADHANRCWPVAKTPTSWSLPSSCNLLGGFCRRLVCRSHPGVKPLINFHHFRDATPFLEGTDIS